MDKKIFAIRTAMLSWMYLLISVTGIVAGYTETAVPLPVLREASRVLIMDQGRIKPLEVFARYTLFALSGSYTCGKSPAIFWLCKVMFRPEEALDDSVFLINDPAVADAIGIPPVKKHRYPLRSLLAVIDRVDSGAMRAQLLDPADRSGTDREVLRLSRNIRFLIDLSGTLSFETGVTDSGLRSRLLPIIPVEENGAIVWHDPAEWYVSGNDRPADPLVTDLFKAHEAWVNADFSGCAAHLRAANGQASARLRSRGIHVVPNLELFYTALDPFFWARLAYGLSLFLLLAGVILRRNWIGRPCLFVLSAGFLLHTAGLILRIIIMHRPPVATFYETFVFVAWIGVVLGFSLSASRRQGYGNFIAAFMGILFLSLATRFSAGGDTMGMLAPVLNSNFWLSLHIITIATGYAGCLAAGVLGHVMLLRRGFPALMPKDPAGRNVESLKRSMWALLAAGFTGTTIGTVLGGMWAEQAWGRFWGWDPKENGALLIILWCAILFHSRRAGLLRRYDGAFGIAFCVPLVMLAWVGVNLLGIGMHSYGFTTGGAKILLWVVGTDATFMAVLAGRLLYLQSK